MASNTCALTPQLLLSAPNWLKSCHVITKPPVERPVTVGHCWSFAVCVLTRNSDPTLLPFPPNSCAWTLLPLVPPSVPLGSIHVTTTPPFDSPATLELCWL